MAITEKRVILYILYVLIVAGLIVGIALAFRPIKIANTKTNSNTQSSTQPAGASVNTKNSAALPNSTPSNKSSTSSSSSKNKSSTNTNFSSPTSSGSSTSTSKQNSSNGKSLSNTGPGDTIGIFIVSSVTATLLWRRKLVRNVIR